MGAAVRADSMFQSLLFPPCSQNPPHAGHALLPLAAEVQGASVQVETSTAWTAAPVRPHVAYVLNNLNSEITHRADRRRRVAVQEHA